MDVDRALAAGLTREIDAARTRALDRDPRTTEWTDRDVARRMSDAGWPIAHPAVIRARQGKRTVSVGEWLTFAFVLSVPPMRLIEPDTGGTLTLAGDVRTTDEVQRWMHGHAALPDLADPPIYYAVRGRLSEPQTSHFTSTLRSLADQFDTATEQAKRDRIAVAALSTIAGYMQARHTPRKGRNTK